MKKLLISLIVLTGLSVSGLAFADGAGNGISAAQSPHNFADDWCGGTPAGGGQLCSAVIPPIDEVDGLGGGWNSREEICRVCHVPHDHNRITLNYWTQGLLWNHAPTQTATWTPYTSGSMDATTGDPSGPSLLCLGCHDGTTAIDSFDNHTATPVNIVNYNAGYSVPGVGLAEGDLSGSHPYSMSYYDDLNMKPDTTTMGTSGTIADVLFGDTVGLTATVECSSCHDVHDQNSAADTHLLRVANSVATGGTASGLCLTCHDK